jgi:hypothetical protein
VPCQAGEDAFVFGGMFLNITDSLLRQARDVKASKAFQAWWGKAIAIPDGARPKAPLDGAMLPTHARLPANRVSVFRVGGKDVRSKLAIPAPKRILAAPERS